MRPLSIPQPSIDRSALVLPGAQVHGDVTLGARSFVLFGTVIRAEFDQIEVGEQTNIQDNSVVHCDEGIPCRIGNRVTVGHRAVIHGATIGDGALIGMGSVVLNRAEIGEGSWLAAGSVLTEGSKVPPMTLAVGAPAKPKRDLTEDEVLRAQAGVDHYLALADAYRLMLDESL